MFGRQREFLGYRGFGVLGEEIETLALSEGNGPTERAEDHVSVLHEAFEAEPTRVTSKRPSSDFSLGS